MAENQPRVGYDISGSMIDKYINDMNYFIRTTEINLDKRTKIEAQMGELRTNIESLTRFKQIFNGVLKDIEDYKARRKAESLAKINNAIRVTSEIIPDAMPDCGLTMKGDEAWLESNDGILTELGEGDGFNSILSALMRALTVEANGDLLQFLIMDETFDKVSTENSATLSTFLSVMAENMQIISIEQKPEVYSNLDYIDYHFDKQGKTTKITKSVIKREIT